LGFGFQMLEFFGIKSEMNRIGGGEALTHPEFETLAKYVVANWSRGGEVKTTVATNDILPQPVIEGVKYNGSPPNEKEHKPVMISPYDLGIPPEHGVNDVCRVATICGRGFDCHGFASCPYAGPIGRVLGIDPYNIDPVKFGLYEICKHCIHSLGPRRRRKLWESAQKGDIDFPTKTFAEGLKENQTNEPVVFERLEARIDASI